MRETIIVDLLLDHKFEKGCGAVIVGGVYLLDFEAQLKTL